ncbi:MAG: DUF192 domain-containing protein [Euryarchaeota archaeon]|nr:DUF192 domain-containing protein [Euryarchaeota archaeon]
MKKAVLISLVLLGILLAKSAYFGGPDRAVLEFESGARFSVLVMDSPLELGKGLTGRQEIDDSTGSLFVFSREGYYSFWTKGMAFPVDIIWLNQDWEVVDVTRDVPPCSSNDCPNYRPKRPVSYVLEINAGLADKYNISEGSVARVLE